MDVYVFNGDTGEFLRSDRASIDTLETEAAGHAVWLLPSNATFTAPPEEKQGHARVWNGAEWDYIEDNRGQQYWLDGDTWQTPPREMTDLGPLPDGALRTRPAKPFEEVSKEKLVEINATYDAAMSSLVSTYPQTELLTFDQQEAEARAWQADSTVQTPLVDMMAQGRQMDKAELVRRIMIKAEAFKLAAGYLTGQRQRYEDMLAEAGKAEEIAAIVPEYHLPE